MHPRLAELFAYIDQERHALRATIDAIPEEERNIRPAPDRWSVRDILEHLVTVEARTARMLEKRIAEAREAGLEPERDDSPVLPTLDRARLLDRRRRIEAPTVIHPQGSDDVETLWTQLAAVRVRLRAAALTGDGLALGTVLQSHPALGTLNLYQWIGFVGGHEARHAAQMREVAAEVRAAHHG